MAHEDHFSTLAFGAALLATGAIFVSTHIGSVRFEEKPAAESVLEIEQTSATPAPDRTSGIAGAGASIARGSSASSSAVAAKFDSGAESACRHTGHAGGGLSPDQVLGIVEAIIELHSPRVDGWDLPTMAEVLVREDCDGRLVVAPGTHRRYEQVRDAIAALDGPAVAAACTTVEQALATGLPGENSFRTRVVEALDLLLEPELPDVELDMVSRGSHWGFADPGLDDLAPAQKHMLLMGIDNQRVVRAALQDIRHYLGGPPTAAPPEKATEAAPDVVIARAATSKDRDQAQVREEVHVQVTIP